MYFDDEASEVLKKYLIHQLKAMYRILQRFLLQSYKMALFL